MKLQTEIIGIAGVIVAILAWQYPQDTSNLTPTNQTINAPIYTQSELVISGIDSSVRIEEATTQVAYEGGEISGIKTSNTIYLPKGQVLSIKVTGIRTQLEIEKNLIEFVKISGSGMGTNIIEI